MPWAHGWTGRSRQRGIGSLLATSRAISGRAWLQHPRQPCGKGGSAPLGRLLIPPHVHQPHQTEQHPANQPPRIVNHTGLLASAGGKDGRTQQAYTGRRMCQVGTRSMELSTTKRGSTATPTRITTDALVRFMHQLDTPSEQIAGMRGSPVWPMLEAVAPTLYGSGRMGSNLVGSAATGKYDAVRHGRRSGSRLSHVYHRRQRTRPKYCAWCGGIG